MVVERREWFWKS